MGSVEGRELLAYAFDIILLPMPVRNDLSYLVSRPRRPLTRSMSPPPATAAHDPIPSITSSPQGVLFLVNDLRMGGAERTVVNLANHGRNTRAAIVLIESAADLLTELRTEHMLYTLDESGTAPIPRGVLEKVVARAPRRRRGQPRGRTFLELPTLLTKAYRLARIANATNAAVVSSFLNRSHTIALLSKMVFAPRTRVVINVHEMMSDHLDRHFAPMERRFMRQFIRRGFTLARMIVAVSEGVKQDLVRHFAIAPDRISVVPNPLDSERIRQASQETIRDAPPAGSMLIVSVGRLVALKGFDLLIRAFAKLRASPLARLIIVGEGDQRAELEMLISELGLSDRVVLVGTQANPWKYMARADVVALASRSEAFPNVIGEALALGRPVIATECSPGVAEYLDHGRYGMLVAPNDVDALAAGLERILSDGDLRRRFATAAPARVEAFEVQRIADRYETLLLEATH